MTEKLTRIRFKDRSKRPHSALLDWGEHTFEEMVRKIKESAQHQHDEARLVLDADPSDFEVDVVRGSIVQHFVRAVAPTTPEGSEE